MTTLTLTHAARDFAQDTSSSLLHGLSALGSSLHAAYTRRQAINEFHALRRAGLLDIEADQVALMVDELMAARRPEIAVTLCR